MAAEIRWDQKRALLATLAAGARAAPGSAGRSRFARDALLSLAVAVIYLIAGKLGLKLAYFHPSATAVWPPSGISLVALLLLGYRVWPGIFVGALVVNLTTAGSLPVCLAIAAGNTLEGLLGCFFLNRFAGGEGAFESAKGVLKFVFLAAIVSTIVSAAVGTTSLSLGGFASWTNYKLIGVTWWLGDAVGDVLVAPLLVLWSAKPRLKWSWMRLLEAALLLAYLFVSAQLTFGAFLLKSHNYPLEFLCVPALVWAAFRFRPRRAQLATCLLAGIAIRGTLLGHGPFVRSTQNESLLLAQTFIGVMAVMTLLLATVVEEHLRSVEQIRHLAATDPLTGLANYRKFLEVLDAEIKRSDRTGRPFAVLLLDLDGLKRINDAFGHLVGSRALCRLAHVLRSNCRTTDTAARYGGDEFAVVLPEAGAEAAEQVALRIREQLALDTEHPGLSVSAGAAVFPANGETRDELLRSADVALYRMKVENTARPSSLVQDA